MPLFEYHCKTCGHHFETLVVGSRTPVCPRCSGRELEKEISTFGVGGPGRGPGGGLASAPSCSVGGG